MQQLEVTAAAAEALAAEQQQIADRDAAIVATEAELSTCKAARDRLAAEAGRLNGVIGDATERLGELAASRAEAEQRRQVALARSDVAAVRDAMLNLSAVAEVEADARARLTSAGTALAQMQAGLAAAEGEMARLAVKFDGLEREAAGLPPRAELAQVAAAVMRQGVIAMAASDPARLAQVMLAAVPDDARGQMAELIRLGPVNPGGTLLVAEMAAAADSRWAAGIVASLEQLATSRPADYVKVRDVALNTRPAAQDESAADDLAPGYLPLDDGTMRYLGRVPATGD